MISELLDDYYLGPELEDVINKMSLNPLVRSFFKKEAERSFGAQTLALKLKYLAIGHKQKYESDNNDSWSTTEFLDWVHLQETLKQMSNVFSLNLNHEIETKSWFLSPNPSWDPKNLSSMTNAIKAFHEQDKNTLNFRHQSWAQNLTWKNVPSHLIDGMNMVDLIHSLMKNKLTIKSKKSPKKEMNLNNLKYNFMKEVIRSFPMSGPEMTEIETSLVHQIMAETAFDQMLALWFELKDLRPVSNGDEN